MRLAQHGLAEPAITPFRTDRKARPSGGRAARGPDRASKVPDLKIVGEGDLVLTPPLVFARGPAGPPPAIGAPALPTAPAAIDC